MAIQGLSINGGIVPFSLLAPSEAAGLGCPFDAMRQAGQSWGVIAGGGLGGIHLWCNGGAVIASLPPTSAVSARCLQALQSHTGLPIAVWVAWESHHTIRIGLDIEWKLGAAETVLAVTATICPQIPEPLSDTPSSLGDRPSIRGRIGGIPNPIHGSKCEIGAQPSIIPAVERTSLASSPASTKPVRAILEPDHPIKCVSSLLSAINVAGKTETSCFGRPLC